MRYSPLTLFLILLSFGAQGQFIGYGSYIDTAGSTKQAYIKARLFSEPIDHIDVSEDRIHFTTVPANAIRGFSIQNIPELAGRQFTFRSVLYYGKSECLEMITGGEHLLLLHLLKNHYIYSKDGVAFIQNREETYRVYTARVFADYPLLSEMARNGGFDASDGYESRLIFEEYDKWADANSLQKANTTMALKGVIDANRTDLPKKLFWSNFWYAHATGFIGLIIRNKHGINPKLSDMPVYDPQSMCDPDYARGYKLRILTRMRNLITKGQVMGLFLPPIIFI